MADIADHLNGGAGTEDTIDRETAADLSNHQDAATDDTGAQATETGRMSVDTAALGGAALTDAGADDGTVTDADGGAR